jgi:hypothetical protein
MKQILSAACAALALLAAPVMAQDAPKSYVWISFIKAKPGQGDALIGAMIKEDSKIFDALVDGGQANDWGVAMPVFHDGKDPYSHVEWISFNGWAGADAFMTKFMESRRAMSAEQNKAMSERWESLVEPGSHADLVVEGLHVGKGAARAAAYIDLGYFQPKEGRFGDMREAYMEYAAPVYDKLVADGTIINYGLATPAVHRGQGWSFMTWSMLENLAALDAVDAAFDAAGAARSAEERKAMQERMAANSDWSGHSDQVLVVAHHKVRAAK